MSNPSIGPLHKSAIECSREFRLYAKEKLGLKTLVVIRDGKGRIIPWYELAWMIAVDTLKSWVRGINRPIFVPDDGRFDA